MNILIQELLDASNEVVSNLMKQYHDSRAVPSELVRLCAAINDVEEWKKEGVKELPIYTHGDGATYYIDKRLGEMRNVNNPHDRKVFTCATCLDIHFCKYVWDIYNTDGDCLADK